MAFFRYFILCILIAKILCVLSQTGCDKYVIKSFHLNVLKGPKSTYNKAIPPQFPAEVNSTFVVHDIVEVNEIFGYAMITIHFLATWVDSRLAFPCYPRESGITMLSPVLHEEIWRPPMVMTGATLGLKQKAPLLIKNVEINYEGRIRLLESFTGRFPCVGNYRRFPFDLISCNLFIAGSQPTNAFKSGWLGGKPLKFANWAKSGSFLIGGMLYHENTVSDDVAAFGKASYFYHVASSPSYTVVIGLQRQYEYYILAMFLPIVVIVVIAWMSMWFPFDSTRISICMTCILSIMLQYVSISSQLPKVGYVKGLDVLLLGCLLFLGAILLEYTVLMVLLKDKSEDSVAPTSLQKFTRKKKISLKDTAPEPVVTLKDFVNRVDVVLKWIVLFLFIAFLALYYLIGTGKLYPALSQSKVNFIAADSPEKYVAKNPDVFLSISNATEV